VHLLEDSFQVFFSSGVMGLVGEPTSFLSPLLRVKNLTRAQFIKSSAFIRSIRTPMLPVIVPALATIGWRARRCNTAGGGHRPHGDDDGFFSFNNLTAS
jgi:hypothetical protein